MIVGCKKIQNPLWRIFIALQSAAQIVQVQISFGNEHPSIGMRFGRAVQQIWINGAQTNLFEILKLEFLAAVGLRNVDFGKCWLTFEQQLAWTEIKVCRARRHQEHDKNASQQQRRGYAPLRNPRMMRIVIGIVYVNCAFQTVCRHCPRQK